MEPESLSCPPSSPAARMQTEGSETGVKVCGVMVRSCPYLSAFTHNFPIPPSPLFPSPLPPSSLLPSPLLSPSTFCLYIVKFSRRVMRMYILRVLSQGVQSYSMHLRKWSVSTFRTFFWTQCGLVVNILDIALWYHTIGTGQVRKTMPCLYMQILCFFYTGLLYLHRIMASV